MSKNKERENNMEQATFNDQVEGRNSVLELLESGKDINKLYISDGEKHGSIHKIIALAKERKVVINKVDKYKLDRMSHSSKHRPLR